jgi:hypothetical protein
MKYLILSFFIFLESFAFGQHLYSYNIDSSVCRVISRYPIIEVKPQIKDVFHEVIKCSLHCPFYQKDSLFYLVSCSKQDDCYYFFVRPWYFNYSPNLNEYDVFGATLIDKTTFLFYGLNEELCFAKKIYFRFDKNNINVEQNINLSIPFLPILCDGCSKKWGIIINGIKILIDAEICE